MSFVVFFDILYAWFSVLLGCMVSVAILYLLCRFLGLKLLICDLLEE